MLDPTTVETVRTAVETHPNTWLAIGVAVGPVATAALIGWVTIRFVMPAVREELAASRKHMTDSLTARGAEAENDAKAARELARVQHEAIVERIEAKIGHLDERAKTSETLLRSIAAKIGAVVLVPFSPDKGRSGGVVGRCRALLDCLTPKNRFTPSFGGGL